MINEIFAFGYGGPDEQHLMRWTKEEMHAQCDNAGVLSLWVRYVTYYPPEKFDVSKEELEREALAQMAISEMLK